MSGIQSGGPIISDSAPIAAIRIRNLWWVAAACAVMIAAIVSENVWYLNFVHVMAGVLWTGIDLFMGFVVGPALRRAGFDARRAIVARLTPVMLFLMPTLAIVTTTAGWYLAVQAGYPTLEYPEFWWFIAALIIAGILTVQGMCLILPINFIITIELCRDKPDMQKVDRLMAVYVKLIALQGIFQVMIILVMARFATGI